ncbi:MAG: hypothetical protein EOP38_17785 [Rubrivivax sp.]|nr:MAG: hypothetical protein EOP38_17785 [Rubrivivax sp.]
MDWMIYGANGYTGQLIAREAVARGLRPVLAGRSADKLASLARELGLAHRVFALDQPGDIATHLQGIGLVLLTAGPFSATSAPMVQACLQARAHYLDITGEIDVFERVSEQHARAQTAGVVLCPGVGFDVIPTDCLAAALKAALPDATELALGFDTDAGMSPGTLKTTLESAPQGGCVRVNGSLVRVPLAHRTRRIDFGRGTRLAMAAPWGDVSTAFHSTGIPNVTVYFPVSPAELVGVKLVNALRPLLGLKLVQRSLAKLVSMAVHGADAEQRARTPTYVWGEVVNAKGERRTARIKTDNGYSFTVTGALAVVAHLLTHGSRSGGFFTPSKLMGSGLVSSLPNSGPIRIE